MPVRNHITFLEPASAVAKEQNDAVVQKATGEVKKTDPKNASAVIQKHTRKEGGPNPNTQLDTFEKQVASGEVKDPEKVKAEQVKENEVSTDQSLTVAHPATSKELGGKEVEEKAKKK